MPKILIVCTANQCRSPIAAALLQQQLTQQPNGADWIVESAGTWATKARPAHAQMCVAGGEVGMDLSQHRSRNVEDLPLPDYHLILTMEQSHKEALQVEFPAVRPTVYQLTEMVGLQYDIADPIGGTIEDFRNTVVELKRLLKFGLPQIIKLATQRQTSTIQTEVNRL
jgi:protein-tyrosine-phosphatase